MKNLPMMCLVVLLAAFCGACGDGAEEAAVNEQESLVVRPFLEGDDRSPLAICYGPHRDGQHPDGTQPSREEIREDLHIIAKHWGLVRTYGASSFGETILGIIREDGLDLKLMMGVWIGTEPIEGGGKAEHNRLEVEAGIRLANAYPELVAAVCVGNETQVDWSAHRSPQEVVIRYLRQVRAAVAAPVTNADDFGWWIKPESRALAAELDFVTTHAHPLWNGRQLEEGLSWTIAQYDSVCALHDDRPVVIGETGWATSIADVGEEAKLMKGTPGETEQARFYEEIGAWAEETGAWTFVFEAFDENWKGPDHPDAVEKHWGLYRADRTPKSVFAR